MVSPEHDESPTTTHHLLFTIHSFSRLLLFFASPDRAVRELAAREADSLLAGGQVARVLIGADENLLRERERRARRDLLLRLEVVALQLLAAFGVEEDVLPLDRADGLRAGVFDRQARRVLEDVARRALDAQRDARPAALHHLARRVAVVLPLEADDLDERRAALVAARLRRRERRERAEKEGYFQRRSHPPLPRVCQTSRASARSARAARLPRRLQLSNLQPRAVNAEAV